MQNKCKYFTAVCCSTHNVLEAGLGGSGEQPAAFQCFVYSAETKGNTWLFVTIWNSIGAIRLGEPISPHVN